MKTIKQLKSDLVKMAKNVYMEGVVDGKTNDEAFEDGLEADIYCEIESLFAGLGIDEDRLDDICQAEREGRVRIIGVPKGACCGTCEHFEREAGTAHGNCKIEGRVWIAQSRIACKMNYKPRTRRTDMG